MRIFGAITLTALLLIGTYFYTSFADSVRREPIQLNIKLDDSVWRLEIDRTFDCIPDPDYAPDSIAIQLKGNDLFRRDKTVSSTEPIVVNQIRGIEMGANELFIEANLASLEDSTSQSLAQKHAMRIRIFRGSKLVKEKTIWAEEGETSIVESIRFETPIEFERPDEHDH